MDAPPPPAPLVSSPAEPPSRKRPRDGGGVLGGGGGVGAVDRACSVHVSGCAPGVTDALLYELFLQCGPVARVWLQPAPPPPPPPPPPQPPPPTAAAIDPAADDAAPPPPVPPPTPPRYPPFFSPGALRYGFVEFTDEASVAYACRVMDGLRLAGNRLRVTPSGGSDGGALSSAAPIPGGGGQVFLRPLDEALDKWDLTDLAAVAGRAAVVDVRLPADPGTGRPRGFAFVCYPTVRDAADAAAALDGQTLCGRVLSARLSDVSVRGAGGGGGGGAAAPLFPLARAAAAAAAAAEHDPDADALQSAVPATGGSDGAGGVLPVTEELLLGLRREAVAALAADISADLARGAPQPAGGAAGGAQIAAPPPQQQQPLLPTPQAPAPGFSPETAPAAGRWGAAAVASDSPAGGGATYGLGEGEGPPAKKTRWGGVA